MTPRLALSGVLSVALWLGSAVSLWVPIAGPSALSAQQTASAHEMADVAHDSTSGPTLLTPADYGRFERLGSSLLSPRGAWLATDIRRVDEDSELRLRPVARPDSLITVPFGSSPAFSDDERWFAALEGVGPDESEAMRERGETPRTTLVLVDLGVGDTTRIPAVSSFAFSADARFIALRASAPDGERDFDGVDLRVRELETGSTVLLGNVSEYAWADEGAWLATLIDAEGATGNGIQLFDAASGRLRALETRPTHYSNLVWRPESTDLAALRRIPADADGEAEWSDTAHVALALRSVERDDDLRITHIGPDDLPAGLRIPAFAELAWDRQLPRLRLGLDPREPAAPTCEPPGDESCEDGTDDEERPSLEIWHAADIDIVPTQKVRAGIDRRRTRAAVWHVEGDRITVLDDGRFERIQHVEGTDLALGFDVSPWDSERRFAAERSDVHTIDVESGTAVLRLEGEQFFESVSPDARWLLRYDGTDYHALDLRSGAERNLTADLGVTFTNTSVDYTIDRKPPWGSGGWLADGSGVLLYDEFDAWLVAPDGSSARRVTRGREQGIRHRRVYLDYEEPGLDPDEAVLYALYNDATEEFGYGRARTPRDLSETVIFGPYNYGTLRRADEAEVYSWVAQSFEDSPDVFVAGPDFSTAVQVTQTNPFQSEHAWGRAELIDFTNEWGEALQGSLYYPADWQPGRRYPMIVYIYETRAQDVRTYHVASERDYYDFQAWVQNGYFVFQPDIAYRERDPGVSARAAIEPAVRAVLERGEVDPDRIGLIGHSWGGYQATYMATVSDLFAASVAGAPLTNLFSMYLSIYWNSGGTDARIFEISQGRMEVPFWQDEEAYRRNSPVFHIESMTTPLLMAQGTEDGAVDFNQGVEFYNAARRADKEFVFLVYNGENHGFAREANQRDYHRRILEWFGHYLKGEPAPDWIRSGVPYLEQLETAGGSR